MGEECAEWSAWEEALRRDLAIPGVSLNTSDPCDGSVCDAKDAVLEAVQNLQTFPDGPTRSQALEDALAELGDENNERSIRVYLGTASRVLPETLGSTDLVDISGLSQAALSEKIRKAFEDPVYAPGGPGRHRASRAEGDCGRIEKRVVVKEKHAGGEVHFHWAIKFFQQMRFGAAKRTLRERDHIASHWSCSHTQWWSALRYLVFPTLKKPIIDKKDRHVWTWNGEALDLFHESQEPWMAQTWKRRREEHDLAVSGGVKKKAKFTKLDLTSLILDKGLSTRAALLEFTQDHGSAGMHLFVHQNQRKLKEYLEDAREWEAAREAAKAERESDWEVVCRFGSGVCKIGSKCNYTAAANRIFQANETYGLSREAVASALRSIIIQGPSKTSRVPMLVGPTNTGKTTLIAPFDKVYTFSRVMHKPALGSKYALRNILKDKRFLMWDDYHPVLYSAETVPVATFLSLFTGQPFEVQMSQSFNDGNEDFEWRHGSVMTAKEHDLWKPVGDTDLEDVTHMKSRVELFPCRAKLRNLKDTSVCPHCMCKWICEGAAALDSRVALQPVLPLMLGHGPGVQQPRPPPRQETEDLPIAGFEALIQAAHVTQATANNLRHDLTMIGAVDVCELTLDDWKGCNAFINARPLEQRRLLNTLGAFP